MKLIGINIKSNRESKSITLRELAKKTNVSASLLSQVENGKVSPSLATLKKIADALDTTLGILVGEESKNENDPVLRESQRKVLSQEGKGVKMYVLTSKDCNKQMEPLLFELQPKASSGKKSYKHFGQEFVLVIKGTLEITLNDNIYVLKKGDSIYFNSNVPHYFRNIDKKTTEAVWVVTPPTF